MPLMRHPFECLRCLVAFNLLLIAAALIAGWIAARVADVPAFLSSSGIAERAAMPWIENFRTILVGNATVALIMLLGACTLGAVSVVTLSWNGFLLGFGLSSLVPEHCAVVLWLLSYVPLEFAALALVATASETLSVAGLRCLLYDVRPDLRPVGSLLRIAAALLLIAAAIEASVVVLLNETVRPPRLEFPDADERSGAETAHEGAPRLSAWPAVLPVSARAFIRPRRSERSWKDNTARRDQSAGASERRRSAVERCSDTVGSSGLEGTH